LLAAELTVHTMRLRRRAGQKINRKDAGDALGAV
jgi:hypothetical protein